MIFSPLDNTYSFTPGGFYTIASQQFLTPDRKRLRPGEEDMQTGAMKYVSSNSRGVTMSYYDHTVARRWVNSFYPFNSEYYIAEVDAPADQKPSSVSDPRGSLGAQSSSADYGSQGGKKRRTTNSSRVRRRSKTRKSRRATGGGR